jgi:hypothetical protein
MGSSATPECAWETTTSSDLPLILHLCSVLKPNRKQLQGTCSVQVSRIPSFLHSKLEKDDYRPSRIHQVLPLPFKQVIKTKTKTKPLK